MCDLGIDVHSNRLCLTIRARFHPKIDIIGVERGHRHPQQNPPAHQRNPSNSAGPLARRGKSSGFMAFSPMALVMRASSGCSHKSQSLARSCPCPRPTTAQREGAAPHRDPPQGPASRAALTTAAGMISVLLKRGSRSMATSTREIQISLGSRRMSCSANR